MRRFVDQPIKIKLAWLTMFTTVAALVLAGALFVMTELALVWRATVSQLNAVADVVGANSRAALAFGDQRYAGEALALLAVEPHIESAMLFDEQGRPFAQFHREGIEGASPVPRVDLSAAGHRLDNGKLLVFRPVALDGDRVGTICIRSDLRGFFHRIGWFTGITLLMIPVVGAVILLLWNRLQGVITRPIHELASTVQRVSADKDYSVRAAAHGRDELGVLIDGFNEMLARIEERDDALAARRRELEQEIAARTTELVRVNRELEQEIAERKQIELDLSKFKCSLDLTLDCVFMLHPETLRFIYVNRGAVEHFGYAEVELRTMTPWDLEPDTGETRMRRELDALRNSPERSRVLESRVRHKDGSTIPVELFVQYVELPGGSSRYVAIVRDLTERKKVERIKQEFISTISHELRTPMTSIRGALGLLAAGAVGPVDGPAREMIDIAHRNSDRLVRLVNEILDLDKLSRGKVKLAQIPVTLTEILERAVRENLAYASQFNAEIRLDIAPAVPPILADPDRLMQLMANLLSNAARFSHPGGMIEVRGRAAEGAGRIEVVDQGEGIPLEFHDRVFEKFSQADSTNTRSKYGTGLGLSICKAIVEQHGGRIGFTSTPGEGTTFWVEIPLAEQPQPV